MTQHPNDKAYTMGYKDGMRAEWEMVCSDIDKIIETSKGEYSTALKRIIIYTERRPTQEDKIK